ncbi:MAG: primosomal protein DnaI [Liquorilactobacillus ghanensis]|uniref:Primosomal protein DnaI n=1 Tax=Liquorilactobacillus ghanensis DSM 18630 TaxID=1423750 RepID=A0A0R1VVW4_9LACO|nr:primosomal protein DnaI [Liquorilactobacillus ghanensis]KRM07588.1 primosomal protein DnaI [Liquorilactobacillus ghanensis DSM 18630]
MKDIGKEFGKELANHHWNENYRQLVKQAFADPEVQALIAKHRSELTNEELKRSASKVYEFVTIKNQLKRGESTLAPGYEPKLSVVNHTFEVAYVPSQQLLVERKLAEVHSRVKLLNLPKSLRQASLADFEIAGRERAANAATEFIQQYLATPHEFHQGLYLSGSFGVGKTYLLAAIANQLAAENIISMLVHFPSFAVKLKNSIGTSQNTPLIETVKKVPVLMLDDIGADQLSSWIRDDVLGVILQYRMQEQLATFFSSNLSQQQLLGEYLTVNNRGEAEPLKAQRIMERVRYLSREIVMIGQNRRRQ